MSPKRRKSPGPLKITSSHPTTAKMVSSAPSLNATLGRSALHAYIEAPASFPTSRVLSYDDDFVVIRDAYPCLLYTSPSPRDRTRSRMPSSA